MPYFLAGTSEVTDEGSEEPDSLAVENFATSETDTVEEILNSTQINIFSSAPSLAANPATCEQEISESSSSFYFNKSKKKKNKSKSWRMAW